MSDTGGENYIRWKQWDFEKFAQVDPGSSFYFDQFFNRNKVLSFKNSVLEIGFGNGELLGYLRAHDHRVIGVEINAHLVERAIKSGYKAFTGLIWDIPELQLEKFDLIVAFDVAEHMTHMELNALFSWAKNHLNKGGKLILRFPEGASPFGLAYQNGDFTHVTSLTKGKITALCDMNSLQLLSYRDEFLRSNKLCSFGFFGKMVLLMLQGYASLLRLIMRVLLYPLSIDLRLGTNSIAVIAAVEI
ncbi:class I SAM-dependent methyltransferase [Sulfuricella sp.]|uniref:class I SAM-dependent methyltransferase n=1 Tax=Sulfuricella sp. TaxID=2099377 RepID=UPI002C55667D|nr:class I SAM-dependent methyltransferase [Sulfuricella sp.]HUX65239.1 class I SAM-dependent methyltransferase [Sulfuricella sp.]